MGVSFVFRATAHPEIYTNWHTISRQAALRIWKGPNIVRAHLACLPGRLASGLERGAISGSPAGDDDARRRSAIHAFVGNLCLRQRRLDAKQRRAQQTRAKRQSQLGRHHSSPPKIGRAHVCTPVTNAHIVCRLLLEKKKHYITPISSTS